MEIQQVFKVVKGARVRWESFSRTVTLGGTPLVLSYGNNTIAVGLLLNVDNIIIFDAITGSQVAILSSHTGPIRSLVFSLDERLLVSGSYDRTVKLWDIQTGGVIKSFCGHTKEVLSVSISADCTTIVSGSIDQQVCLWSIHTGNCHHSI